MNILLFGENEWGKPLDFQDLRAKHVREILRANPGDLLKVGLLGRGTGSARILSCNREEGKLVLEFPDHQQLREVPGPYPIDILIGHPRIPVMRRLCRDLCSIGLRRIWVCGTELSEKSYFSSSFWTEAQYEDDFRLGAMQASRVDLPQIERFWTLKEWIRNAEYAGEPGLQTGYFFEGSDIYPLFIEEAMKLVPGREVLLAIGPERGWTQTEIALLKEAGLHGASLGSRILRTETAALLSAGMTAMKLGGP